MSLMEKTYVNLLVCSMIFLFFFSFLKFLENYQPGMHVNGAPQMMQPPNMGVVPGPIPGPGPGPGTGPVGPPGKHQAAPATQLVVKASSLCSRYQSLSSLMISVCSVTVSLHLSHLTTN